MRSRNREDLRNRMPEEPKDTGYLSGILTMAVGVVGLLIVLIFPGRTLYFSDGEVGWGDFTGALEEGIHFFPSYALISFILTISIIAAGAILVITTLLTDVEVMEKNKSLWINFIAGKLLLIPSLALIFVGTYVNASLWTFFSLDLTPFFFSPFLFLIIGIFGMSFSFSICKNSMKCIQYNIIKEDIIHRKRTRPIPVKKPKKIPVKKPKIPRGDYK